MTSPARGGPDTAGVDPAEIVRQRTLGWPDFHPEDYCHRCGRPNPNWAADTEVWQTATGSTGDGGGILCPSCFCALWEQKTGKTAVIWRLSIDPRSRDARAPGTAGMREALLPIASAAMRSTENTEWLMARLLPVVQRLAVEKAAEEADALRHNLRELCDSASDGYVPIAWLRELAAAAQPTDGRTGE